MVKKKFDKSSRLAQVHIAVDHLRDALDMQRELRTGLSFYSFLKWTFDTKDYLNRFVSVQIKNYNLESTTF